MGFSLLLFAVVALQECVAYELYTSVTPVEKVVQLLTDMSVNAKEGKNAEAVEYAKFHQFCSDTTASKTAEVEKGTALVESLTADVNQLQDKAVELSEKIHGLQDSVSSNEASIKEAQKQREEEKMSFAGAVQDHLESTDALERAIAVLQKQNFDRAQVSALLLQLPRSPAFAPSARRAIEALIELGDSAVEGGGGDYLTREAPEAAAYEFQSGGIVELLKRLLVEFKEKRTEAEKQEMNSRHTFELLLQDLNDNIENAKADIATSTASLQETKATAAETTKRLTATAADRDEDAAYLNNLKVECSEKAKSFQEKQGLREEEIKAIQQAIEILRSPDVLGAAQEHLPAASALEQLSAASQPGTSLAQLRAGRHQAPVAGATRGLLANYLRSEGQRLRSTRLSMLAQTVALTSNPFGKVKKMIEELIQKLLQEAGEEIEHKGWCDTELGTNAQTRTKLQGSTDAIIARVDGAKATIAEATQRLAELSSEVADLTAATKQATEMRQVEKAKNEATIKDAVGAQKAVSEATVILKEFYAKATGATALVEVAAHQTPIQYDRIGKERVVMGSMEWQALANPGFKGEVDRGHKAGMQTFGATYQGQQGEVGGVLAMLEVIASDFANLEAGTAAAETEAAHAYQDFMAESSQSVAVKDKEMQMLTADRLETEAQLRSDEKDLKATQDQLLAAERYFEELKPSCIDTGATYEKRAKARSEELQSLQEALHILKNEDFVAAAI